MFITPSRLGTVSLEQRARKFDERGGRPLGQQQVAHVLVQAGHEGLAREPFRQNLVEEHQRLHIIARKQHVGHRKIGIVIEDVERLGHILVVEPPRAERHGLVEHRQRVAHTAVGLLRYEVERLLVIRDTLRIGYMLEIPDGILDAYAVEVVDLAARKDRRQDLVFLRCGEDEDGMLGRLLECLQKGVEGLLREHVHLVDDEDRIFAHLRKYAHLIYKRADVVHRVVRCGVQLVYVERAALIEGSARLTLVARLGTMRVLAVYRLGEDTGAGGLAHAARPAKQIGMSQLATLDRILERRGYALLAHNRRECRGAVFSCRNDKITHNGAKVVIFRAIRN